MDIHSAKPNWLARTFEIEPEVGEKLLRHSGIYFTELLLLWIVTTSSDLNHHLFDVGNFKVDVMKLQTLGFVLGGFFFGWLLGENKLKGRVNRIKNLKISLWLYVIGALISGIFTLCIINDYTSKLATWGFAVARTITCIGISGGIGINLTILALSTKGGKHSAPILLFTVFGVMGTVICCSLLTFITWKYLPPLIFFIAGAAALVQMLPLNREPAKYNGEEYINQYEYKINLSEFWSRIVPFVILGLPPNKAVNHLTKLQLRTYLYQYAVGCTQLAVSK